MLELIGTTTLGNSLRSAREPGIVCMTSMVGNAWSLSDLSPMEVIPTGVCLTTYAGGESDFMTMPMQELIDRVAADTLPVAVGRSFALKDTVEARRTMEENPARGKVVGLTSVDTLR